MILSTKCLNPTTNCWVDQFEMRGLTSRRVVFSARLGEELHLFVRDFLPWKLNPFLYVTTGSSLNKSSLNGSCSFNSGPVLSISRLPEPLVPVPRLGLSRHTALTTYPRPIPCLQPLFRPASVACLSFLGALSKHNPRPPRHRPTLRLHLRLVKLWPSSRIREW